jgi:hypothetical protein
MEHVALVLQLLQLLQLPQQLLQTHAVHLITAVGFARAASRNLMVQNRLNVTVFQKKKKFVEVAVGSG